MKFSRDKTTATAVTLFLIFAVAFSLVALPVANAHSPPWTYQFYARVHVAPDPVGVSESVIIVAAVDWALPGAAYYNEIRPEDVTITVTKPDGTTSSYHFDTAPDSGGSAFINYTPDKAGNYTATVVYSDTVYHWNSTNTPGLSPMYNQYYGDIWYGSTATRTFTVQEEPVGHTMVWPLPTEYWTRPIFGDNYAWQSISSNWLAGASAGGASISTGVAEGTRWQQDGTAPHTAHIMWTKPIELGGTVGGAQIEPPATYYSGMSYQTRFSNPIVISGILFYYQPLAAAGSGGGYVAVDLRTGQELWRADISPSKGQLLQFDAANQHGTVGGILWQTPSPFGPPQPWIGYDAFTGKNVFNLTGVPNGYEVYDTTTRYAAAGATVEESAVFQASIAGDITRYVINYNTTSDTGFLSLWSDAQALSYNGIQISGVNGREIDASNAYAWNVSLPNLDGQRSPVIVGVIPNDILVGTSSTVSLVYLPRIPMDDPWVMWAISLKPESRGQLLWKKTYAAAPGNITRMLTMAPVDPVNRVWTMKDFDTSNIMGFSIDTGDMLWNTFPNGNQTQMNTDIRPIQWYSVREGIAAYGILYISGYGGEVLAYSTLNGTLLWKFNDTDTTAYTSGIPWGLQTLHVGAMADGLVFAFAGEHSPITPLYTGYRMFVLDAFTGEKVWDLFGWSSSGLGTSIAPVAIADGFLAFYNCYDGQVYSVGKGPSATTVTASPKVSVHGGSVLVEGTVTDISAGTKQDEQAARFPNGVPAVSDANMTAWMEYVYQQKPRPTDVTGVEVVLTVLDPNNNYYEVGKATSDENGMYSVAFTPEVPGKYTILATFEGSNGYWPSHAETAINVEDAPAATPAPTPTPAPMTDTYVLGIGSAILIAVIIGFVVLILIFRKR